MLRFFLPLAYNAPFFRGIWNNNHAQLMPFYDIWNTSFLPHPAITLAYYAPFCPGTLKTTALHANKVPLRGTFSLHHMDQAANPFGVLAWS